MKDLLGGADPNPNPDPNPDPNPNPNPNPSPKPNPNPNPNPTPTATLTLSLGGFGGRRSVARRRTVADPETGEVGVEVEGLVRHTRLEP